MAAPSPHASIDWASLSSQKPVIPNSHVQVRFRASTKEWYTPTLVPGTDISVSGLSSGLNYGQQCYEGMKAFRTVDGRIVIFRPKFHGARMRRSAESVILPPPPEDLFLECVRMAVAEHAEYVPPAESGCFLYIRPLLFAASTSLWGPADESILAIFVHPTKPQRGEGATAAIVCDEFDRCAPKGMGSYKVGGNYAPCWRYVGKYMRMGYGALLHLDSATNSLVEEFTTSGFLGHKMSEDGRHVLVVPDTDSAINSTTANSIIKIAEREGWVIKKTKLPFSSVGTLDEVVSCGTAGSAAPIKSIDRPTTGEKFTFGGDYEKWHLMQLANTLSDVQYGRSEDTEGWLWEVEDFPVKADGTEVMEHQTPMQWTWSTLSKTLLPSVGLVMLYHAKKPDVLTSLWK